jgi:hypothetical protein
MESFQDNLDDSIPISYHQDEGDVTELQKYLLELKQYLLGIDKTTRLPRGNIFSIKCYIDSIGVEYYFDPGRYSYDNTLKKLWRNKWKGSLSPKLLKGLTIMGFNRGQAKVDLKKLKQQLGVWNWWI